MGGCQSIKNNNPKFKTINSEDLNQSDGDKKGNEDCRRGSSEAGIERSKARGSLTNKSKGKKTVEIHKQNTNIEGAVMADGVERAYDNRYLVDKNDLHGDPTPRPKLGDEIGAFDRSRMYYAPDNQPVKIEDCEVLPPDTPYRNRKIK